MSEWIIVSRSTVMDGLVLDWYRDEAAYASRRWVLSASRDGVLVGFGVVLHTIPEEEIARADSAFRLLRTRGDRDRELARDIATHRSVGFMTDELAPVGAPS